jgi:hypothetical protein
MTNKYQIVPGKTTVADLYEIMQNEIANEKPETERHKKILNFMDGLWKNMNENERLIAKQRAEEYNRKILN